MNNPEPREPREFGDEEDTTELPIYVQKLEQISPKLDAETNTTGYSVTVKLGDAIYMCRAPSQIPEGAVIIDGPIGDGDAADAKVARERDSRNKIARHV